MDGYFSGRSRLADLPLFGEGETLAAELNGYVDIGGMKNIDPENIDLDSLAQTAMTERIRSRLCSVGGIGTGNLVYFQGRRFIVTCRHVADSFFSGNGPYVILRDNQRIQRTDVEYVDRTNDEIDTAIIEILDDELECEFFEERDLKVIDDFSEYPLDEVNLLFCGFPSHLSRETEQGIGHMWMSYMTLVSEERQPSENFLYCSYEMEEPVNLNKEDVKTKLPRAPGLSGAFMLEVAPHEGDQADLWSPDDVKVIALQRSWDRHSWVKGVNVKHAVKLMENEVST